MLVCRRARYDVPHWADLYTPKSFTTLKVKSRLQRRKIAKILMKYEHFTTEQGGESFQRRKISLNIGILRRKQAFYRRSVVK